MQSSLQLLTFLRLRTDRSQIPIREINNFCKATFRTFGHFFLSFDNQPSNSSLPTIPTCGAVRLTTPSLPTEIFFHSAKISTSARLISTTLLSTRQSTPLGLSLFAGSWWTTSLRLAESESPKIHVASGNSYSGSSRGWIWIFKHFLWSKIDLACRGYRFKGIDLSV